MIRSFRAILLGAAGAALLASPAFAHSEIKSTNPAKFSHVLKVPKTVTMTFTEAPRKAKVAVHDGCGRSVATAATVKGARVVAKTPNAEPGPWHVIVQTISAEDGDLSRQAFQFHVGGRRDCTPGGDKPGGGGEKAGGGNGGTGGGGAGAAPPQGSTGSSFPVLPAVLAGAGIIVLAVIARFAASR